jgi:hypothetical protein
MKFASAAKVTGNRGERRRCGTRLARVEWLAMRTGVSPRLRPRAFVAAVLLSLPAILFYGILLRKAVNVPLLDDYEALLDFLNHLAELESASARVSYFLAAQFNEYKLFFGHVLAWLQLAFLGHTDLRVLCAIGNGFVLLLAILLWMMFLPDHENLTRRMALFIPVSSLLFQLGYSATLAVRGFKPAALFLNRTPSMVRSEVRSPETCPSTMQ